MDDIRELESDTQRVLQEKLSHIPAPLGHAQQDGAVPGIPVSTTASKEEAAGGPAQVQSIHAAASQPSQIHANGEHYLETRQPSKVKRKGSAHMVRRRSRIEGSADQSGDVRSKDSDTESMYSTQMEFALDSIALSSDSGSDTEFFDAIGRSMHVTCVEG